VSIDLPWESLGLSRVRVLAGGEGCFLENGVPSSSPESVPRAGLTRAVYPTDADESVPEGAIDLRLLARILHPMLSDHRLRSVAARYGVPESAVSAVFRAMIEEAVELDRELVGLLARLLPPPLSELFDRILVLRRPKPAPRPKHATSRIVDVDREGDRAASVLGSGGVIAAALPAYEERSGQLRMAEAVEEAFRDGEALLVEAGPGTGKTFAYLVPAILHLRQDPSMRVVVSTRTKQLQEQLYEKDLPFLLSRLAPDMKVALLKGRENYLCLRRWQARITESTGGLEPDRAVLLAPLARWILESETGDIDENGAFLGGVGARALWGRLCDAPNHCVGAFCPFLEDCFSIAARRRARKADLVVVNHSLLLGDLAVGGVVLGRYSHLIVDEAHQLESAARTAFTKSLSERIIERVVDDLAPSRRRGGWLHRLPHAGEDTEVEAAVGQVATVRRRAKALFRELDRALPEERRGTFSSLSGLEPEIGELGVSLEQLEMALDRVGSGLEAEEARKELEGHVDRVSGLGDVARSVTAPPDENTVHWYEREQGGPVLHATPLDVAPFFQRMLYPRIESIVLASATLSLAGDFEYVTRSLGLTDGALRVRTSVVESPFSFGDRMKIAVPTYFPSIDSEGDAYVERLASLLGTLAVRLDRKGLALFTSYRILRAVRDRIAPEIMTLAQGVDGPRSKLIERFRRHDGAAILLGTESFWEGVDLPGDEMEYLVITRLPFSVPTDPVLSALADRMASEGRDPFRGLWLPQAVLRLRQGVGRLIRTKEDRGIVVLTDQRILSRSYGPRFLESLPVPADAFDDENDLVGQVVDWFATGN